MKYIIEESELQRIKEYEAAKGYDKAFQFFADLIKRPEQSLGFGKLTEEWKKETVRTIRDKFLPPKEKL